MFIIILIKIFEIRSAWIQTEYESCKIYITNPGIGGVQLDGSVCRTDWSDRSTLYATYLCYEFYSHTYINSHTRIPIIYKF